MLVSWFSGAIPRHYHAIKSARKYICTIEISCVGLGYHRCGTCTDIECVVRLRSCQQSQAAIHCPEYLQNQDALWHLLLVYIYVCVCLHLCTFMSVYVYVCVHLCLYMTMYINFCANLCWCAFQITPSMTYCS